jgi:hypothetical protein
MGPGQFSKYTALDVGWYLCQGARSSTLQEVTMGDRRYTMPSLFYIFRVSVGEYVHDVKSASSVSKNLC